MDWGWRIPFLLGIGLFIFSLIARRWLTATEAFTELEETESVSQRNPIKEVCAHSRLTLLKFVTASSLQHGSAYLIFVFVPTFLSSSVMRGASEDGWTDPNAFELNSVNSVVFLPLCVVIGYFADKIGAFPFLAVSATATALASPFVFYALAVSTSSWLNWALQFGLVLAMVPIWSTI